MRVLIRVILNLLLAQGHFQLLTWFFKGVGAWEGRKWNYFKDWGPCKTPWSEKPRRQEACETLSYFMDSSNFKDTPRMRWSHSFRASSCTTPGSTIHIVAMEMAGVVLLLCYRGVIYIDHNENRVSRSCVSLWSGLWGASWAEQPRLSEPSLTTSATAALLYPWGGGGSLNLRKQEFSFLKSLNIIDLFQPQHRIG